MRHIKRRKAPLVYDPVTNTRIRPVKYKITDWGLQAKISKMTHISTVAINFIFNGRRRATVEQAEKLEAAFATLGIHINRLDLLYEVEPGQNLYDYLREREEDKL